MREGAAAEPREPETKGAGKCARTALTLDEKSSLTTTEVFSSYFLPRICLVMPLASCMREGAGAEAQEPEMLGRVTEVRLPEKLA